jgi:hypothetical protein
MRQPDHLQNSNCLTSLIHAVMGATIACQRAPRRRCDRAETGVHTRRISFGAARLQTNVVAHHPPPPAVMIILI